MNTASWLIVVGIAFTVGGIIGIVFAVNAVSRWQRRTGKVL